MPRDRISFPSIHSCPYSLLRKHFSHGAAGVFGPYPSLWVFESLKPEKDDVLVTFSRHWAVWGGCKISPYLDISLRYLQLWRYGDLRGTNNGQRFKIIIHVGPAFNSDSGLPSPM